MPRRCPGLSRPLRVEPCPFLCATADLLDLEDRQFLTMAMLAAVVLAPLLLEDDYLGAARLLDDPGLDRRACDQRRADCGRVRIAEREHLGDLDMAADIALEPLDGNLVADRDAVLLPACLDDCEHDETRTLKIIGRAPLCQLAGVNPAPNARGLRGRSSADSRADP